AIKAVITDQQNNVTQSILNLPIGGMLDITGDHTTPGNAYSWEMDPDPTSAGDYYLSDRDGAIGQPDHNDEDWYVFQIPSKGTLTVDLSCFTPSCYLTLTLYAIDGQTVIKSIASDTDNGQMQTHLDVGQGTYYDQVSNDQC